MRTLPLLLMLAGCGAASPPATTTSTAATTSSSAAANGNGGGTEVAPEVAAAPAETTLVPGFSPTPMLFHGRAGGPVDGTTRGSGCYGRAPMLPQHTIEVLTPIPYLTVAAYAGGGDILLHVRLPDGSWVCNDDWDGLSPRVEMAAPRGRLEIFVASFQSNAQTAEDYVLGIAEDPNLYPSNLPYP